MFGGVFFMNKYSDEFKLTVVKYCIEENHGIRETARHFKIPSKENVQRWVRKYQEHGVSSFLKNIKTSYTGKFKINVVEYMHTNHLSALETSIHFKIQTATVLKWKRIYYEEGPQALYESKRGRPRKMSSKLEKKKLSKEIEEDLIAENQRLRMENEYLKKLNALIQERIKRENKKK